jgi:uncharacterized membrane protein
MLIFIVTKANNDDDNVVVVFIVVFAATAAAAVAAFILVVVPVAGLRCFRLFLAESVKMRVSLLWFCVQEACIMAQLWFVFPATPYRWYYEKYQYAY